MKIVRPRTVWDTCTAPTSCAELTDSDVPETDAAEWNSGTAYTIGQQVIRTATHRLYEALTNNTNKTPETYPADWLDVSATNRYKMFDYTSDAATVQANQIEVEITPGAATSALVLFGVVGLEVAVSVDSPTLGNTYSATLDALTRPDVTGWWTYFFSGFLQVAEFAITDLACPPDGVITVTITAESGTDAECAALVVGNVEGLGVTVFGSSVGIIDYSRREVDDFGNYTIVRRKSSQRAEFDVYIETTRARDVQRRLDDVRSTPTVFIGDESYGATIVLGFYDGFNLVLGDVQSSSASLSIEGVL